MYCEVEPKFVVFESGCSTCVDRPWGRCSPAPGQRPVCALTLWELGRPISSCGGARTGTNDRVACNRCPEHPYWCDGPPSTGVPACCGAPSDQWQGWSMLCALDLVTQWSRSGLAWRYRHRYLTGLAASSPHGQLQVPCRRTHRLRSCCCVQH